MENMDNMDNMDNTEETRTGHLKCHWKDCGQFFPDHTSMASHLSEGEQTHVVIKKKIKKER
jgi:hypothetical protein